MTTSAPLEHHHSAETSLRGFLYHAPRVATLPRCAWQHSVLFQHFFGRQLESRFQGTVLGPAWVLVQPLFLFSVYFLVFGIGLRKTMGGDDLTRFAVYLFSGIICFHALVSGTTQAMSSIVGNSNLVKKVAFPCELLPVIAPAVETTVFLIGFGAAAVVGWLTGVATPGLQVLALPLFVLILLSIGTGLGLLLANLNVFVRDVQQLYSIITTPWLFMSPNFWTPRILFGEDGSAWAETLSMAANPAYCLLLSGRQIIGMDSVELGITSSLGTNLAVSAAWGAGLLLVGYGSFMTQKHKFADLV